MVWDVPNFGGSSVLVQNAGDGKLGMKMKGMVLDELDGSPKNIALMPFVGMKLTHVNNSAVRNEHEALLAMSRSTNGITLTFDDVSPALGSPRLQYVSTGFKTNVSVPKGVTGDIGCVFEENLLQRVIPGSNAELHGLSGYVGRTVTHVNGIPVADLDDICKAAASFPAEVSLTFHMPAPLYASPPTSPSNVRTASTIRFQKTPIASISPMRGPAPVRRSEPQLRKDTEGKRGYQFRISPPRPGRPPTRINPPSPSQQLQGGSRIDTPYARKGVGDESPRSTKSAGCQTSVPRLRYPPKMSQNLPIEPYTDKPVPDRPSQPQPCASSPADGRQQRQLLLPNSRGPPEPPTTPVAKTTSNENVAKQPLWEAPSHPSDVASDPFPMQSRNEKLSSNITCQQTQPDLAQNHSAAQYQTSSEYRGRPTLDQSSSTFHEAGVLPSVSKKATVFSVKSDAVSGDQKSSQLQPAAGPNGQDLLQRQPPTLSAHRPPTDVNSPPSPQIQPPFLQPHSQPPHQLPPEHPRDPGPAARVHSQRQQQQASQNLQQYFTPGQASLDLHTQHLQTHGQPSHPLVHENSFAHSHYHASPSSPLASPRFRGDLRDNAADHNTAKFKLAAGMVPYERAQMAQYELIINKAPQEPLGLSLAGMNLHAVAESSAGHRAQAERFIGMKITHVEGDPISNVFPLTNRSLGNSRVTIRFAHPSVELDEAVVDKAPGEPLGLHLEDTQITHIAEDSPADLCGLDQFIGRELTHINNFPVTSPSEVQEVVREADARVPAGRYSTLHLRFDPTEAPNELPPPGTQVVANGLTGATVPNGAVGTLMGPNLLQGEWVAVVEFPPPVGQINMRYSNLVPADAGRPARSPAALALSQAPLQGFAHPNLPFVLRHNPTANAHYGQSPSASPGPKFSSQQGPDHYYPHQLGTSPRAIPISHAHSFDTLPGVPASQAFRSASLNASRQGFSFNPGASYKTAQLGASGKGPVSQVDPAENAPVFDTPVQDAIRPDQHPSFYHGYI